MTIKRGLEMQGVRKPTISRAIKSFETNTLMVPCPVRGQLVALSHCLTCVRCAGLQTSPSGHTEVACHVDSEVTAVASGAASRAPSNVTPISAIMKSPVVCARPDQGLAELLDLLITKAISGVPVVDHAGHPIGIVSKTDLLREFHQRSTEGASEARPEPVAANIMRPIAFVLPQNESISRAAALMAFEKVHRVPVVGPDNTVTGIVSSLDVLGWLAKQAGFVLPD